MPQTGLQISDHLAIQLEARPRAYTPGDIIIGTVTRKSHLVTPEAILNIQLKGRAKSKMVVKRSNGNGGTSTHTYRGRFNFFTVNEISARLLKAPVHIPPGGAEPGSWPFALTLPAAANPRALPGAGMIDPSYLHCESGEVYPLPDSIYFNGRRYRTKFEGYVEYHIEAELIVTQGGKRDITRATLPIQVRTPTIDRLASAEDFKIRKTESPLQAHSYLLTQDPQLEKLTFKQKCQSAFNSSKVPVLDFTIQVSTPGTLQLDNMVPFAIRIVQNLTKSSDEVKDTKTTFRLVSLKLRLKSTISVLCKGSFSDHDASDDVEYNFGLHNLIPRLKNPLMIPSGNDVAYLDIGELLGVTLMERGVMAMGEHKTGYFPTPAYPTMATYNVKHDYRLKWELGIAVGRVEKVFEVEGMRPVTLLGAAEIAVPAPLQLEAPPPMEAPPPTFEASIAQAGPAGRGKETVAPPTYEASEGQPAGSSEQPTGNEKQQLHASTMLGESSRSAMNGNPTEGESSSQHQEATAAEVNGTSSGSRMN